MSFNSNRFFLQTFLFCSALPLSSCAPEQPAPNLLLITVDTLRADALGCYPQEDSALPSATPRLDTFAKGAVVFEDAQSTSSWTLPSLASLMTGTYSSTHQCWETKDALDASFVTLAERLSAGGYATSAVASHTFLATKHGLHQGFEDYDTDLVKGVGQSHKAITSPEVTERSLAWLDAWEEGADGRPFLLWSHYFDPHEVYHAHAEYTDDFGEATEAQRYRGEVAFTDRAIGGLLDGLAQRGLAENTVVVLISDHGEEFGDHGGTRHGHTLYSELTHVPLLIRAPNLEGVDTSLARGGRVSGLVSTIDLLPTFLELARQPALSSDPVDGVSLVPYLRGLPVGDRTIISEVRLRKGKFADAVYFGDHKLIVHGDNRIELFDRKADPLEQVDLIASGSPRSADIVRGLQKSLRFLRAEADKKGQAFGTPEAVSFSEAEWASLSALGYTDPDEQ